MATRMIPGGHIHVPIIDAHAALGTLAWGLLLPVGAILFTLRRYPCKSLLSPRFNIFWTHTTIQSLGIVLALANFGTGVHISLKYKKGIYHDPHTIVGTVVIALMVFQPVWGGVHHVLFKRQLANQSPARKGSEAGSIEKEGGTAHEESLASVTNSSSETQISSKRWTWFGMMHRWIGRVTITLAIINGGLGFMLSMEYRPVFSYAGMVVYSVFVASFWVVWMMFILGGFLARRKEARMKGRGTASYGTV